MSFYVKKPTLVDTVSVMYPGTVLSSTDPDNYSTLVWEVGTPVVEATLLVDQLTHYRDLVEDKIRREAHDERYARTNLVLGTEDSEQIRTYDEKYLEASAYLVNNSSPTPIMSAEITHTGETIASLAVLVVSQYDAAKATLKTMWGNIEGTRRVAVSLVATYSISQLEAYTGPVWT